MKLYQSHQQYALIYETYVSTEGNSSDKVPSREPEKNCYFRGVSSDQQVWTAITSYNVTHNPSPINAARTRVAIIINDPFYPG